MDNQYVHIELTVTDDAWAAFNDVWLAFEMTDGVTLEKWESGPIAVALTEEDNDD